jgi:uncharacterized FlaG/YvyC family protein
MSQIAPVAAVTRAPAIALPAVQSPVSQRELRLAVAQVNENGYAGEGREAVFSVDRATKLPVVKIIDSDTKEVINQWPAEYVLRLAQSTRDSR